MKALGHKLGAYARLLRRFVELHGADMSSARQCLADGRLEEARLIAHTLKGLSASLGLCVVQEQAQQLDMAIRAERPLTELGEIVDALERELEAIGCGLLAALP